MASANPPPASVQQSPGSPDNSGDPSAMTYLSGHPSLPVSVPANSPATLARIDLLLAVFAVTLAFLTASTPARNSNVWLHLAIGRALADGSYSFHGDPFGPDESEWIAHSWLYDLVTYGLYDRLGGGVVVFLKAGLVALLAALLICLGSRGRGLAWPTVCASLAVVASCGRLLLQPALVSAFLLVVTLVLLHRARRKRATKDRVSWLRAYGLLCFVFALWANLDDWFLLGPVTVGLYLLGEVVAVVSHGSEKRAADLPGLSLLLGAGLLACLLNPFHIRIFSVPAELGLSATAAALERDPALQGLFVSPFDPTYFRAGAAWSVPSVAYLALVVLSLLSFLASRDAWRSWRLPVWLAMFGLSAWSARSIPFFAVVAGPILALNLQDLRSWRSLAGPRRDDFLGARLGRALAVLLLVSSLVAAWPGWLQGTPGEIRRWAVVADPSVRATAEKLALWHRDGLLGTNGHGFLFSPETANYFAWFCPAEKGIIDSRLNCSAAEAVDYVTIRRALLDGSTPRAEWRSLLRKRHVNHVILYDSSAERVQTVYRHLVRNEREWPLLLLSGRTAVFGWVDPQRPETASIADLRLRVEQAAYHPSESQQAPAEWPGREPQPFRWWQAFVTGRSAGSPDRDEAALWLLHFETLCVPTLTNRGLAWEASLIGGAVGSGGSLSGCLQQVVDLSCMKCLHPDSPLDLNSRLPELVRLALSLRQNYFQTRDDAPPELLWLAIRAARRALHANPDDAYARLILGQAYLYSTRSTRERAWTVRLPFLSRLREVQAAAAFHQALLLQPDLMAAHAGLVALYQHQGLWDLRLRHLREVLRLAQAEGPRPDEAPQEWEERLSRLRDEVGRLQEGLQRLLDNYEVSAAELKIIDRAETALKHGLGGKALDILLASDTASFGQRGIHLELNLLLTTGRVAEVRQWLLPEHRQTLGDELYLLIRMELAAACGDYDPADIELAELAVEYEQSPTLNGEMLSLRQAMSIGISHSILDAASQNQSLGQRYAVMHSRDRFLGSVPRFITRLRKLADLNVLRGLLALEHGDSVGARAFLSRAVEVHHSETAAASGAGLDFGGRPIAEHFHRMLKSRPR